MEAIEDSVNELRVVHAKELMQFATEKGLIDSTRAREIVSEFSAEFSAGKQRAERLRIETDQQILREWFMQQRH